jgi:DNA gyrase subunit A
MDTNIPTLYKQYGEYSNWRNFPSSIDGLKPVERRTLFSAFVIAKNKFVKSARIDGHVIGNYHPHGSVYGTIVQMVRQGFLDGQGNFGSNVGVEQNGAAASRYTEVKLSPMMVNLAFNYIEYSKVITNELGQKEPKGLPTLFPICLIGKEFTQGIGFGYKTYIPCYEISHLYQRLSWLLKRRKTKPTILPITDCNILSPNRVLEELLVTGKAKVDIQGVTERIARNSKIILRSWPPRNKFESLLNRFSKELDSGIVGFTDLSTDKTEIVFQILRERNRDKLFKDFADSLEEAIKGSISFENLVINENDEVKLKSVDSMLIDTFEAYKNISQVKLKHEIETLKNKINELYTLEKIKPHLSEAMAQGYSVDDAVNYIEKKSGINSNAINSLIEKYRIKKLLTMQTDSKVLVEERNGRKSDLKNIDEYVIGDYERCIS